MICIKNVKILTMEMDVPVFDGEVWVEQDRVAYVGKETKENAPMFETVIDGEGGLLMPGFKNAHTHSPMTFLRSYADDLELDPWLHTKVFPAEAKLTEEDAYWCTLLAIMEYLTSGITVAFDMYFIKEAVARAAEEAGFRMVLCGAVNDFCESTAQMKSDYQNYNGKGGLVSYQLGFHAEYTTSESILREIAALSKELCAPVFTHCAETQKEVEDCIKRTGLTPLAYLDLLGIFQNGGGGFHMIHLKETDYPILIKRNLYCITNPASNLKLASGIPPLCRLKKWKVPIAIGTDGAASNNCLDMFREMFLAAGLQKILTEDASAMPAMDVLRMAAVTGAEVMGLSECRFLKKGMKADLVLMDLTEPNMQPVFDPAVNLVYSGSKQNVTMTMVNGRILYENRKFYIGHSKEEIYEHVNNVVQKIKMIQ